MHLIEKMLCDNAMLVDSCMKPQIKHGSNEVGRLLPEDVNHVRCILPVG